MGLKVSGLDDVVFAETQLSLVDGEAGRLVVRGFDIEQLTGQLRFSEALQLIWTGDRSGAEAVDRKLGEQRLDVFRRFQELAPGPSNGMDFLRYALAALDDEDPYQLVAAAAVATAIWYRRSQGLALIAPDPLLGHGADLLHMIQGEKPNAARARALEAYLVTVMDHGMNASTFAARVVASTGSDLVSAVVAGIGALKGPLHGGAPGPVLDMLEAVGTADHARPWLEGELQAGRRIMGMGHRIYRVRDPRAAVLERAIDQLEKRGVQSRRLHLARSVEQAAAVLLRERYPDRPLKANVEFYTAVLLDAIGLPAAIFSPCFAVGRVVGWCAHVAEQRTHGRLVRPQSTYVGP